MRLLPSGDKAILVDCADAGEARVWAAFLGEHLPVTLGAQTVLVHANRAEVQRLVAELEQDKTATVVNTQSREHTLAVSYDGPDLNLVAKHTGLGASEIVEAHTSAILTVGFSGFAPGFAYLVDGDARLTVPRLAAPRPNVAAGSVALAGAFSGIYPRESAGGWLIIGHTREWLWDLSRDQPARLQPGDTVRFEAIG
ncbi:MAG: allophanate hydrolase subunit 1 [Actinomycetales bacterium]|nr:allophanate hydrolase subunit 1 [Actinomycetales bacterium]